MNKRLAGMDYILSVTVAIILVISVSVFKYRGGDINYYNSDATWHTLLTIEAYNETPISQHLFLPLVSLGDSADKWIPWGATVPDSNGNYYYTSFSPAGYFFPWLFMKILDLPVGELSLYLFNSILFIISAAFWGIFLGWIFNNRWISLLGIVTYVCTPELLHGMGITYWHQSLYQVLFIVQIMAYYRYKFLASNKAKYVFYIMTLINPYVEWTGYVTNAGICIVELLTTKKEERYKNIKVIIAVAFLTIVGMVCFILHYLLRIDKVLFFEALRARFFARNVTTDIAFSSVIGGYFKSFGFIWVLCAVLIAINVWVHKSIRIKDGIIILLLLFPMLENYVMKQHALVYSYDRMKGIFVLSFLCCELMSNILDRIKDVRMVMIICLAVVLCCLLNLLSYVNDESFIWNAGYRANNEVLAEYINEQYPNSVLGIEDESVRGYTNMLFQRGVYERITSEELIKTTADKGMRYAISLKIISSQDWNMTEFGGAEVYDVSNGEVVQLSVEDGSIIRK